jgi:RNA polymerase sigma-70 factor, ECF subfamily
VEHTRSLWLRSWLQGLQMSAVPKTFTEVEWGLSDLVVRILAGERDAEEELFYRYRSGVAIIVRRIAKNFHASKDLSQDTFRLVLEKIRRGDLRDPEKLSGFICGIARNLSIEHLRRMKRLEATSEVDVVKSIPDPAPGQLSLLLKKEKAHAIRQMLDELEPARDREILYRFYLTEDDKEKICNDLGLSSLHFNRVLYRAKERFRTLYETRAQNEK